MSSQLDKLYREAVANRRQSSNNFVPPWWNPGEGLDSENYVEHGLEPLAPGTVFYDLNNEDDPVATWIAESGGMNPHPWVSPNGQWGADYYSHGSPADRKSGGQEPDFESAKLKANDWIQNYYKEQTYDPTDDMSDEEYEAWQRGEL